MKLAISTASPQLSAPLDARFGRCMYFIIIETTTRDWDALPNPAASAGGGAGTQAVQFLTNQGVGAVVGPHFGPNAFTALEAAGIQIYSADNGQADELLEDFIAGRLEKVTQAGESGRHGGQGRRR